MTKGADNPTRRLLKLKPAAEYLSMSPRVVRKLVQSQQLRVVRLEERGPWWLDVKDLDQFIETRKEFI
jgi:hypothetical protein